MIAGLVIMALAVASAGAQADKPNFNGTWILTGPADVVKEHGPLEERIIQTAEGLTRGHDSEGGGHKLTYKFDGTETENRVAGIRVISLAKWEGTTLILTDRYNRSSGALEETSTFLSLNGSGDLLMGGEKDSASRWTYKKK